jgi:hypothetical protein
VRLDPEGDIPPTPGKEVRLTLDADIQNRALEVMGDESGAIVVMDVRNGDLLAMVSAPSFDANRFVKGLSGPEYKALAEYERKPLLDKALSGNFPPGSTFKPTVGLAALTAGVDPEVRVSCGGSWYYGGRTWRCWEKRGHGSQNLHEAIKNSCDIYFYQTSLKIGPDAIATAARAMGFGDTFDIGIPGQKKGLVPDRAWKKRAFKKNPANQIWFPGETPSYGIGQGALSVNALQLAVMTSRLANGKKALNPRLIKSVGGVEQPSGAAVPDLPFTPEHLAYVRGGMEAVANDVRGTAYRQSQLGLGDVKMAGKTGTAQVRSYDNVANRKSTSVAWRLKDHNLFVAFAPYDDPRYAVAVIIEHGGLGGATAGAPRAREVMRVALLKDPEVRARIERPMPLPEAPVEATPDGSVEGAAPDDPTIGAPPRRRRRLPRPLSFPRLPPPEFPDDPQRRPQPARRTRPADHQVHGDRLDPVPGPVPDRRHRRAHAVLDRRRLVGAVGRQASAALRHLFRDDDHPVDGRPAGLVQHGLSGLRRGLLLLVAVEAVGDVSLGAQRWLAIGPLRFQPSEIMKIGVVLALARYYHGLSADSARLSWKLLVPLALIGAPTLLVAHQPDLGTAVLIALPGLAVMVLAGLSLRLIIGGVVAAWPPCRRSSSSCCTTISATGS